MRYFSGFCLQNESALFNFWLVRTDFTVAGFSYGAIKAVESILEQKGRADRLILLSPAFFNDKDEKFKRMQLLYFKKEKQAYINNFINNARADSSLDLTLYLKEGSEAELKELLFYNWQKEKLQKIAEQGTIIEVILGGKDKIINPNAAKEFFQDFATVYWVKEGNHFLIDN